MRRKATYLFGTLAILSLIWFGGEAIGNPAQANASSNLAEAIASNNLAQANASGNPGYADFMALQNDERMLQNRQFQTPAQKTVYLTFDDGPSRVTDEVLGILREYGVQATFFVLGQQVERFPDRIRQIVADGHAVGNHSYNHTYRELYQDFRDFGSQIEQTDKILSSIAGIQISLLRAPGGTFTNFDAFYFYYLDQANYLIHDWSVDGGDLLGRGIKAKDILANVQKGRLAHEVTLLLHDGAGHEETAKALPQIIEYYRGLGYRFAKLDERVKPVMHRLSGETKWQRPGPFWQTHLQLLAQMQAASGTRGLQGHALLDAQQAQDAEARMMAQAQWVAEESVKLTAAANTTQPSSISLATAQTATSRPTAHITPKSYWPAIQPQQAKPQPDLILRWHVPVAADAAVVRSISIQDNNPQHPAVEIAEEQIERPADATLPSDKYLLRDGRLHVPVRVLAGTFGADVHWHEISRTVVLQSNGKTLNWQVDTGGWRVFSKTAQGSVSYSWSHSGATLIDGILYVPLRSVVQQLDGHIVAAEMNSDHRTVTFAIQ